LFCECYVLSGWCLCGELITHPKESYWLWCVVVCDLETWRMRRPWPTGGCRSKNKRRKEKSVVFNFLCSLFNISYNVRST